ncbi:DNA polymerase III subunit gamma and tau [Microbacterium sp. cx-55]|uniref:DNA polymerase III subunit gamma and tau n=1 Tax=Microbacterium sp. cx-55 TaxID=2875948 RepID=UPI001CBC0453|nr:DNA polymerase III subunit gamma and tau [Microbacterium sp. cx-55]MBZ4487985.1 DNA polymerase III subunit gamma and tau [Microbacterium sp. cx-55]UGB34607.1 DNA polymerase III subunit gamma and tau [Microbacterium sp. cx-55]
MTTALYRRYRPESFGEMIGQTQVTDPLMTALRGDRIGHAYLFSGPRGCGKTTSARILARCLNCAAGPTDTPCGTCDSCVELGRGGGGSLDVVEIDAASHNGVDDARDLRERAIFAPARDRFKIFILDEAHMVTPQGFNALLKLVEEPPAHVKFIFATTEPEKVIGTIRSRTHHYPFRLVPPAAMLEYVQTMCETEGVTVEPGVLPLVVRAGGGSPRDTLSLLDQLIAGSENSAVSYERAVALLGYTHAELLDEVVEAFGAKDAGAAFAAVDRVVQTGQDPRRFVEDLLERLRDLIVIAATGQGASAVLRGIPADDLERMARQATMVGTIRLSRTADIVIAALDEMTGATSPRLQLELMVARVLAHTAPAAEPLAVAAPAVPTRAVPAPAAPVAAAPAAVAPASVAPPAASAPPPSPAAAAPAERVPENSTAPAAAAEAPATPAEAPASADIPAGPITTQRMRDAWPEVLARLETISRSSWLIATVARVAALDGDILTLTFQSQGDVAAFKKRTAGSGPSEDLRQAIQGVLGIRVKYIARHDSDEPGGDGPGAPPAAPDVPPTGGREPNRAADAAPQASAPRTSPAAAPRSSAPVTEWAVASIPTDAPVEPSAPAGSASRAAASSPRTTIAAPRPEVIREAPAQFPVDDEPEDAASVAAGAAVTPARDGVVLPPAEVAPSIEPDEPDDPADEETFPIDAPVPPVIAPPVRAAAPTGVQRYGEAVVRQVLGARFVREETYERPTRFA